MSMLWLQFASLVYISVIIIVYFSRQHITNSENNIYSKLLITNFCGIILDIGCVICCHSYNKIPLFTNILCRLLLVYLVGFIFLYTYYVVLITGKKNNVKRLRLYKHLFLTLFSIFSVVMSNIDMKFMITNQFAYTYGKSVDCLKLLLVLVIVFWGILIGKNFKEIKMKKCVPIIILVILTLAGGMISNFYPQILITTPVESLVMLIMYFTIENPDLKMVNELYKNKNIMEQTYEDKSNFVFEITQEVKNPILNINNLCSEVKGSKKIKDYEDVLHQISDYAKQLEFVVNDILDVSTIDAQQIKFVNNKYNLELIFNEVVNKVKGVLPSNVKFSYTISHNVPELYGDSIKLKQILTSLLLNSIKHTKSGFIDFNIDTIQRFDAVRLIISIKDSSAGLSLDKINDILATTGSLDVKDIEAMNQSDMNMKNCQKIMKLMGGNMLIRSGSEKGSEVILTLDQKVQINTTESILNKYEESIKTGISVAVVCQDKDLIKTLKTKLSDKDITASFLMDGYDLIDEVKSGKVFDYIFVENEMKKINGYNIFNELNKIKGFNSKVVMILDKDNMMLKKHLIEDGFSDVLELDNLASEINRIIGKL